MVAWLRSWKGGAAVAAACVVIGLGRVLSGQLDWVTWILFPLAAGYALAAVIDHRARRPATRSDLAGWTTHPTRLSAWITAQRGSAAHPDRAPSPVTVTLAPSTKDRVGALLAVTAAIVGLVLVFQDREIESRTAPAAPQSSSSQGTVAPTG